jgi:hypothetical protein
MVMSHIGARSQEQYAAWKAGSKLLLYEISEYGDYDANRTPKKTLKLWRNATIRQWRTSKMF